MGNRKNTLSMVKLLILGGVIFSMHFGGASMIWPMVWGQESGSDILFAFFGIFFTALLFPLLGYKALSRGKGTLYQVARRISPGFAKIFCGITMLVLGPLFVVPRMSAAAWDAFLQLTGYQPGSLIPIIVFSIGYYLLVYWFISQKNDTVDKVSKYLFPILVITVVTIIVKGLTHPISVSVDKIYTLPAFVYGFTEGYATFELPCALVYATIIITDLKNRGLDDSNVHKTLTKVGVIGIGILTLTHLGHMLVGASTGAVFGELKYAALYTRVVIELWGKTGGLIFNVALIFAALTSAIGLSLSTSDYFVEVNEGKVKYKDCAIVILVVSSLVSVMGLSTIIKYTAPLLDIIYPAAITLTLYYALIPDLDIKINIFSAYRAGMIAAFLWGLFEGSIGYLVMFGIDAGVLIKIRDIFPFSGYKLGWVTATLAASVTGYIFSSLTTNKKQIVSEKGI